MSTKIQLLGKRCFSETLKFNISSEDNNKKLKSEQNKAEGYDFYKKIGSPKYFVAPMVEQSELPYRMLCRKYGAQVCYTPMFHSRLFVQNKTYRKDMFAPCKEDRPLVVQFCANDPQILLQAARYVEDHCDAVDINLGCPQGIARKGNYGSFLLEKTELIVSMVKILKQNLKVPVTCKIRCLPTEEETLYLAKEIEKAGASLLTVHGRTRDHNKGTVGPANYQIIKKIKETLNIPVILNGGISTIEDVHCALKFTGCDGVMSSEAILEYPALYSDDGVIYDMDELTQEYLDLFQKYPGEASMKHVKGHLNKFLHAGFQLQGHTDLRDRINRMDYKIERFKDFQQIVSEMKERRKNILPIDKISWYYRHWKDQGTLSQEGVKNKQLLPSTYITDQSWDNWMENDDRNPASLQIRRQQNEDRLQKREETRKQKFIVNEQSQVLCKTEIHDN